MTLFTLLATGLLAASPAMGEPPAHPAYLFGRHAVGVGPSLELWTNQDEVFQRGDRVKVYFRASEDAYVTVFRVDTDGRVRVLYPVEPWNDNYARREQRYEIKQYGDNHAFVVDDYPGQGYVFGVASRDPFDYGALVRGDHWDYRVVSANGRITGDPYVALTDLVERIIPPNYAEYSYDILPYYVDRHYDYPRFLCYDCHAYASYSYWNPYAYNCFRFRIVIYDDPYYYPVRYYGRPRVVYARTTVIAPRYIFKSRASPAEAFVSHIRARPVDGTGRRVIIDPGVTARDVGGVGRVPAPIESGRRTLPERGDVTTAPDRRAVRDPNATPDVGREFDDPRGGVPDRRAEPATDQDRGGTGRRVVQPDQPTTARPRPQEQESRRALPELQRREPEDRAQPERETREPRRDVPTRPAVERPREPARQVQPPRSAQPERRPESQAQPERRPQPQTREPERRPAPQPSREPERRQAQPRSEPQTSAPAKQPERSPDARRRVN